jgi:lipopolysaccharide biosynthesis glycosyltransferase
LYVVHSSLTDYDFARIKKVSPKIILHPIRVNDAIFENAHFTKRITKETYYRLLLGDLLPKSVDRILYLDPDIVVIKPLDKLYNIDFNGNVIAGAGHTGSVVEWFNKKRLSMPKSSKYINAGVLMVNVDGFRKVMNTQATFDYVNKMGAKLFQADQDVLNALLCRHTIYLDEKKYNLDEHIFAKKKLTPKQVILYSSIIHYDGKNKPWKESYKGSLGFLYDYYENKNLTEEGSNEIQTTIPA